MKTVSFILVLLMSSMVVYAQFDQLVWSDEFDYSGLPDNTKWSYDIGGNGWGNNELQYYTENRSENARVENGKLIIEAHKESFMGKKYTSARLTTKYKGDWRYGRIEVKAKLPGGRGSWPAIWMLPTNQIYGEWPASGEIDIMEYVGYDPGVIHGTVHTQAYNHSIGTQVGQSFSVSDAESSFHVYAIEWNETKINFFVDDIKYFTFTSSTKWEQWPFNKHFHLLLNIAVGGDWGGAQGVDTNIFPIRMEVDYVRIYQNAAPLTIEGDDFVSPNETNNTYSVGNIIGANYNWSVPDDAEIISGQNTNSIMVNWGKTDGTIRLVLSKDGQDSEYVKVVKTVLIPDKDGTVLYDFEAGAPYVLSYPQNTGNIFSFSEENGALKVKYDIQNSAAPPYFELDMARAVDMSNQEVFSIDLRTYNLSNSVKMRVDLVDVNGLKTDYSPVFNIFQIKDDGNFHTYSHNFSGNWLTTNPNGAIVNKHKIKKMIFYVNFGVFGTDDAQDSLWLDNIAVQVPSNLNNIVEKKQINIYPTICKDKITIEMHPECLNHSCQIKIVDLKSGRILYTAQTQNRVKNINTSKLETGLYLVVITSKERLFVRKIVKH